MSLGQPPHTSPQPQWLDGTCPATPTILKDIPLPPSARPFPLDPTAGPGRLVAKASWTDRLPHEGTLDVTLLPQAKERFVEAHEALEGNLSLPGFRKGARHLPKAFVLAEWTKRLEGLVQSLAHEAVTLLKPLLGADLLVPLPEVVAHTNPLTEAPLSITLRLTLQPAPPDPLQGDQVWPPDPALEAMRQAATRSGDSKGQQPVAPAPLHPAAPTAPARFAAHSPQPPPPPPVFPGAAGPGSAPVPAISTPPQPPTHSPDPGGI